VRKGDAQYIDRRLEVDEHTVHLWVQEVPAELQLPWSSVIFIPRPGEDIVQPDVGSVNQKKDSLPVDE
jgi:hypothetical protein